MRRIGDTAISRGSYVKPNTSFSIGMQVAYANINPVCEESNLHEAKPTSRI
jgi:hypothetical protein